MPSTPATFAALFRQNEEDLYRSLARARARYQHSGERGTDVESAFRDFLRRHLPSVYAVRHGEVIDLQGSRSPQCDVLVINPDQPIGLAGEDADRGTFIVEGVSAVGEIKSQLTASTLRDAIEKGRRLKQLRVTEQAGAKYYGTMADAREIRCRAAVLPIRI